MLDVALDELERCTSVGRPPNERVAKFTAASSSEKCSFGRKTLCESSWSFILVDGARTARLMLYRQTLSLAGGCYYRVQAGN